MSDQCVCHFVGWGWVQKVNRGSEREGQSRKTTFVKGLKDLKGHIIQSWLYLFLYIDSKTHSDKKWDKKKAKKPLWWRWEQKHSKSRSKSLLTACYNLNTKVTTISFIDLSSMISFYPNRTTQSIIRYKMKVPSKE